MLLIGKTRGFTLQGFRHKRAKNSDSRTGGFFSRCIDAQVLSILFFIFLFVNVLRGFMTRRGRLDRFLWKEYEGPIQFYIQLFNF